MSGKPLDRVEANMPTALALVSAVREGPDEVARILARRELDTAAVCVALACLVPDDKTPAQLLHWYDPEAPRRLAREAAERKRKQAQRLEQLRIDGAPVVRRSHGSHAGFNQHRYHRDEPCEACVLAERIYQRERARRRRQQTVQQAS